MLKTDLKKEFKRLYAPSPKEPVVVDVPRFGYLMIDGQGDPGSSRQFKQAVEALYPLAYTVKFASKLELGRDFAVMPLQGLWSAEDMDAFEAGRRDEWQWTLMILQPEWVTSELIETARDKVCAKKKMPERLDAVRFESFEEGSCQQILHLGPFSEEGPTIARLHDRIEEMGKKKRGRHHEIYLSDMRRTEPAKLRTILRQPFG